ncbi:MAG: hypothetical protein WCS17_11060 [Prevotella sp.]
MLRQVIITNPSGENLTLDLFRPELSGYSIRSITGLGPVDATINSQQMVTTDTSLFNSALLGPRNIVMELGFIMNPDIETSRQRCYKFFPIKKEIVLTFITDNLVAQTSGYVEKNELDIFSKDETTQISIICMNPYFYSAGENGYTTIDFSKATKNFEFPFSNEGLEPEILDSSDPIEP